MEIMLNLGNSKVHKDLDIHNVLYNSTKPRPYQFFGLPFTGIGPVRFSRHYGSVDVPMEFENKEHMDALGFALYFRGIVVDPDNIRPVSDPIEVTSTPEKNKKSLRERLCDTNPRNDYTFHQLDVSFKKYLELRKSFVDKTVDPRHGDHANIIGYLDKDGVHLTSKTQTIEFMAYQFGIPVCVNTFVEIVDTGSVYNDPRLSHIGNPFFAFAVSCGDNDLAEFVGETEKALTPLRKFVHDKKLDGEIRGSESVVNDKEHTYRGIVQLPHKNETRARELTNYIQEIQKALDGQYDVSFGVDIEGTNHENSARELLQLCMYGITKSWSFAT
jgi:hypothetical protein